MSKTNCVNCGHGKDPDQIKCPFCGTTYLDFTSVDLDGRTPCILSVKLPGTDKIFRMKAIPIMSKITIEPQPFTAMSVDGRMIHTVIDDDVTCDIQFMGMR